MCESAKQGGAGAASLHPAAVGDVALIGAGAGIVGDKEQHHAGDLGGHQLPLQALALQQLGLALRRQPEIDLALRHDPTRRSEEHTSELQSLMRISYAVFCLKKKKTYTQHNII